MQMLRLRGGCNAIDTAAAEDNDGWVGQVDVGMRASLVSEQLFAPKSNKLWVYVCASFLVISHAVYG